jgi:4-hydroxybenzoate polyprenyltransferase
VLDGLVSGGVAALAGAPIAVVLPTGLAMSLLQFGIGALNDVIDAPADAGRKPGKPIPAGLVGLRGARAAALIAFASGIVLAGLVRPSLAGLAVAVIAIGVSYDVFAKGTVWSWLPFAVGIPLLPVFGWVAATGGLDPAFVALVPAAMLAGAALAIANSLVDTERDRDAGASSIAIALGRTRAVAIGTGAIAAVTVVATAIAAVRSGAPGAPAAVAVIGLIATAAAAGGRSSRPERREWAWRAEAVAVGAMALVWLRAVSG